MKIYQMDATGVITTPVELDIYLRIQKQTSNIATTYLYNIETNQKTENLSDITIFNITKNSYIRRIPKYNYYGLYLDNNYIISYKNNEIAILQNVITTTPSTEPDVNV